MSVEEEANVRSESHLSSLVARVFNVCEVFKRLESAGWKISIKVLVLDDSEAEEEAIVGVVGSCGEECGSMAGSKVKSRYKAFISPRWFEIDGMGFPSLCPLLRWMGLIFFA